jgi:hypothetical protein
MVHQDIERHYYVFHESKNDSDHFSLKLLCKMVLIPAFLFVIYLRSISTIQCPSCMDILVNTTNASLPVDKSFCELTSESSSICKSELFVELIDDYPAMISYMTGPTNALVVGNGDSELTRTINIPLDIGNLYASVIYDCYDEDLCNENIVERQYNQLREYNYTKLKNDLNELLYNDVSILKSNQIECRNRNDKIEKCVINGTCQATLIIERGRSDLLVTSCIPDRRPGSISGLIVELKSVGNWYEKTSISYICNKNQCNHPAIVNKVRQILVEADLVHSNDSNLKHRSIALTIICIITHIWARSL